MGSVPPQIVLREILSVPGNTDEVAVGSGVGGTFLVVELPGQAGPCWVCAPVTERQIDCVRTGQASPWTVLHHSCTGTVHIYRTAADGSLHLSVQLCAKLPGARPARAAA